MRLISNFRSIYVAALLLAGASTAHASGFTFSPSPRTARGIAPDVTDIDHNSGSGLLTVCGNASPQPLSPLESHTVSLTNSRGCPGGSEASLTVAGGGIDFGLADTTTLLQGPLTDFQFVPSVSDSSPIIFRFLATMTASESELGYGTFTGTELSTNYPVATYFLSWFKNEAAVADTRAQVPNPGGFALLPTGLAALAAALVIAGISFSVSLYFSSAERQKATRNG